MLAPARSSRSRADPRPPPGGRLEEDLGGRLGRAARLEHLDRPVQVGLTGCEPLGERERVARLHEDVEAPALDLRALALAGIDDLSHLAHGLPRSPSHRRTLPEFVVATALGYVRAIASSILRASSWSLASSTARSAS